MMKKKEKVYPMILYNEANLLYEMEIYREALELCNKGIDYCTRSNKYMVLPYLLLCKSMNFKMDGAAGRSHGCTAVCRASFSGV